MRALEEDLTKSKQESQALHEQLEEARTNVITNEATAKAAKEHLESRLEKTQELENQRDRLQLELDGTTCACVFLCSCAARIET